MKVLIASLISLALLLLVPGCYYDNEESLYPEGVACDVANVSYSATVAPILQRECVSCHSGAAASANIRLSTHAEVLAYAQNGQLYGSIAQLSGYSAMPKGSKLPSCEILKIKSWVDAGAANN